MERQSLPDRFHAWLIAQERRSPLTAETYRFEIRRFVDWLGDRGLRLDAGDGENTVELADISRYLDCRRRGDGIDSRSAAKAISALRSFFRFLENEGIRSDNCAVLLETPRGASRLPSVLSREEIEKMFSLIDTGAFLGIRNRALYELIYSSGMRISEAVSLNTQDVFLSRGMARVLGKGTKERLVIFGPDAASWVKRYLEEVRPNFLGPRRSSALFLGRNGKRLSRKGIWKNYAALAALAGISSKVHTLRHTFATDLLAGGADLRSVQELLGHADLSTTQVYTHLDNSFLEENHRRYLPRLEQWKEYEN